jgi:dihydrofolate reductase
MDKVIWHTMMSLDGFIAGPNDDMRWAFEVDGGAGQTFAEVVQSIGALLVGRRTQDVEDRVQPRTRPRTATSSSSAPTSPVNASRRAFSTRSSSTSRQCSSAAASASSNAPAARR